MTVISKFKKFIFDLKIKNLFKNSQISGTQEETFFKAITTKSKGVSRTGKVSIECNAKFQLSNLTIDKEWLLQNAQNPSDEFFWSIQNAVKDAFGAVIYEHEDLIRAWTKNDITNLFNQLTLEHISRINQGDIKINEEGNLIEE